MQNCINKLHGEKLLQSYQPSMQIWRRNCHPCKAKRQINRLKCTKNEILDFWFFSLQFQIDICGEKFQPLRLLCEMKFKLIAWSWRYRLFACTFEWSNSYVGCMPKQQQLQLRMIEDFRCDASCIKPRERNKKNKKKKKRHADEVREWIDGRSLKVH